MTQVMLLKAGFIAIPLFLLALWVIPLGWWGGGPGGWARAAGGALAAVAWLPPGMLSYFVSFLIMAGIFATLSLGLNCQWGFNGHLNFGIAGFFAVGAFLFALFTTTMPTGLLAQYAHQAFGLGMPFAVGVVAAAVSAAVAATLIALAVLRLRLDFLAIATIGIAEIIRLIFQNERWLANGPQPLRGIPRPLACLFEEPPCTWLPEWAASLLAPLEQRDYIFFYLIIVSLFVAVIYVAMEQAARSPWGRVLRAIREEEASTAMSGKNVTAFRIQAFVVGGVIMGIAGALYAPYAVSIDYSHFNPLFATFIVWVMLMLGGSGNNKGAILGAFVIWAVWSGTAFLTEALGPALEAIHPDLPGRSAYLRWLLVAILLEVIVLYRPQGLLKEEKVISKYLLPKS